SITVAITLVHTSNRSDLYRFNRSIPSAAEKASIERLTFDFDSGYASRASDGFYGIGNQTPRGEQRLQYRSVTRDASAGFTAKFNDTWSAGLHAMYRNVGITAPRDGRSAQDHFDRSTPGLFSGGALRSGVFSISHDTQKREDLAFRGGMQLLEVSRNDSAGKGGFSYWRYHFDG